MLKLKKKNSRQKINQRGRFLYLQSRRVAKPRYAGVNDVCSFPAQTQHLTVGSLTANSELSAIFYRSAHASSMVGR